jgi:AcrR family transcriptional regulator
MALNKTPISGLRDPRGNQKERTRKAIIDAAIDLIDEGTIPTVASAAERAKVSRATAYRYFPTQDDLGEELASHHPGIAAVNALVENFATDDIEERLLQLLDSYNPMVIADEAYMRSTLRSFLDSWLRTPRDGDARPTFSRTQTRMRWLDAALSSHLNLPESARLRVQCALALTLGIEAMVVMKDVCQLEDDDALAVLRWTATVLLRAGLEDSRPSGGKS